MNDATSITKHNATVTGRPARIHPIPEITLETFLYLLALTLALGLRVINLGGAPLSDIEAGAALPALALAQGGAVNFGALPGYSVLTGLLFSLFPSSNGLARLLPALAGSLVTLLPLFFFRAPGAVRLGGIVLAFALAIDPLLVATARLAGGPAMGLAFGLLALGAVYLRRPFWAGLFAGLALLSGPGVVHGVLGLFLSWILAQLFERAGVAVLPPAEPDSAPVEPSVIAWPPAALWTALGTAGGVLLVAGTGLLRAPQGLAALANLIPAYLQGWSAAPTVSGGRLLAGWLMVAPLAVLFALVGGWWGWRNHNRLARSLSLWALVSLLWAVIIPARQASDLAWAMIPLWALAALGLLRLLPGRDDWQPAGIWVALPVTWVVAGQAALTLALLITARLNVQAILRGRLDTASATLLVAGAVILIAVAALLVAYSWALRAALLGIGWGVTIFLALGLPSAVWGLTQTHSSGARELLGQPSGVVQADLLVQTIEEIARWGAGDDLDLVVTVDAPSVRWALRQFHLARYTDLVGNNELPSIILATVEQTAFTLPAVYRGQDFDWWEYPGWQGVLPSDWLRWWITREAPVVQVSLILWVRGDVFPGGALSQQPAEVPVDPAAAESPLLPEEIEDIPELEQP